jgi:hypothetical protein
LKSKSALDAEITAREMWAFMDARERLVSLKLQVKAASSQLDAMEEGLIASLEAGVKLEKGVILEVVPSDSTRTDWKGFLVSHFVAEHKLDKVEVESMVKTDPGFTSTTTSLSLNVCHLPPRVP